MTSDNNLFIHKTDLIEIEHYEKTNDRAKEFVVIHIISNRRIDKQDSEVGIYFNQEQYDKLIDLRNNINNILQTLSIDED